MLKYGNSFVQLEHTPFFEYGLANGHYTIVIDDFSLYFCYSLTNEKSLNGDNKLGAYEFVKKVAFIH